MLLLIFLPKAILDIVVNLQFSLIEKLWQRFWRYCPSNTVEGATMTENRLAAFIISKTDILLRGRGHDRPKPVFSCVQWHQ